MEHGGADADRRHRRHFPRLRGLCRVPAQLSREAIPELERRLCTGLGFIGIHALMVVCFWVAYQMRVVA